MRRALQTGILFGAILSCGGKESGTADQRLRIQHHEVERLTTRFGVEEAEEEIPPRQAFLIRKACPKIHEALLRKEKGASMALLTVSGEQMEAVWGVSGRGLDGRFGIAPGKPGQDGTVRFAVQCTDCDLHLGMLVDGRKVACIGPGYSLRIRDGVLGHY